MSEIIFTPATGKIWECTNQLRWNRRPNTTTDADVLQQAWYCLSTGETEWRAIPIVFRGETD